MTKLVCIDSSVFISSLVENELRHIEALQIVNSIHENKIQVVIPYSVLVEVTLAIFRRTGRIELAEYIKDFFLNTNNIELVNLYKENALTAIEVGLDCKSRGMDAIILGVAKNYNAELISFDNDMVECYSKIK